MWKVVIADDEKRVCQLLMMLADWKSYDFEVAGIVQNGTDLLNKILETEPDLIVTDVKMPGMTGIEVLHKIREQGINTRVIIMSGYREFDYIHAALQDGAVDYWLKPLNKKAIEKTLETVQQNFLSEKKIAEKIVRKGFRRDLIREILSGQMKELDQDFLEERFHFKWDYSKLWAATVKIDLFLDANVEANIQEGINNILFADCKMKLHT